MKKIILTLAGAAALAASCQTQEDTGLQAKVDEYATFEVKSALIDGLSDKDRQVLNLLREAGKVIDGMFWKQTFGDKEEMDVIDRQAMKDFAMINYGPWDRLEDNAPFVPGYGEKPLGANYYPADMTAEEWEAFDDPDKLSPYTVIRRDENGALKCVWYRDEYREDLDLVCRYLTEAAAITENEGLKNYLTKRVEAFRTDNYFESDLAWMDMKDSPIDVVIGPIESYDDKLNELKTSYECFILLKDEKRSQELAKYVSMLPELQKMLPCPEEYKTFVPGTSSDMNVYDAIYYAGDCNCGSKTIAINLPNDDRVQALKGARRLQLHNSMNAKFGKILLPIGREKTTWEEAKADILGLFMVCRLIDMEEIPLISKEDAITTFIAGLVRSVRFGSASSHGKANMMCYNFMKENGAFSRNSDGQYHIDYDKALEAIDAWAGLIIRTQATGDIDFARSFSEKYAVVPEALSADIANVNAHNIPRDIKFDFVW